MSPSSLFAAASDELFGASPEPLPWAGGSAVGGTVSWIGVAGFVFEVDGTRLAVDPFVTRPGPLATLFRPVRPDRALVRRVLGRLDAVFVGHTHYDHAMDLPAVVEASPDVVVHGSATTVELCRRLGVPMGALQEVGHGQRVTVGPFTVETVASRHGLVPVLRHLSPTTLAPRGVPRTPARWPCGAVHAYRIEVADRAFHLHGSAGIDEAALAGQPTADVLIACLAARQGTPSYLDRLVQQLRPSLLIPSHHDNFFRPLTRPPRPLPRLDWSAFRAEAARLATVYGTRVHRLPFGLPVPI
jgi:L-ascorbate metabolism protein UlaG (beta-lactamase superfamily)